MIANASVPTVYVVKCVLGETGLKHTKPKNRLGISQCCDASESVCGTAVGTLNYGLHNGLMEVNISTEVDKELGLWLGCCLFSSVMRGCDLKIDEAGNQIGTSWIIHTIRHWNDS